MRGLRAALLKDLKIFKSGTGVISILLPLVLLAALWLFGGNLGKGAYLEPFPIAVRDLDNTVMSGALIEQISGVELFSEIHRIEGDITEKELFDKGIAAAVTIPKDFFYSLYRAENSPVKMTLNTSMPLESSVFQSIFLSVMDIIKVNQSVGSAVYSYSYGELTDELQESMWKQTSMRLLTDALSRQRFFDTKPASDTGNPQLGFLGCCLGVITMFFPLSLVKALPEERDSGILSRFTAAGGSLFAFFLSKFVVSLLLTAPSVALTAVIFKPRGMPLVLLSAGVVFFAAFGLFLAVAAWSRSSTAALRRGNIILVFSLVTGGALYSLELLPNFVNLLAPFTLPYYIVRGISAAEGSNPLGLLLPAILMGILFIILSVPGFLNPRGGGKQCCRQKKPTASRLSGLSVNPLPFITAIKVKAMTGGALELTVIIAAVLFCGVAAAAAINKPEPESLVIAVENRDRGGFGQELVSRLESKGGVTAESFDSLGENPISREAEGVLTIHEDYSDLLEKNGESSLTYSGQGSAVSTQAAREIVAGQAGVQLARLRGLKDAEKILGRALESGQRDELLVLMESEEQKLPKIYELGSSEGGGLNKLFTPSPLGFSTLVIMLTIFTVTPFMGSVSAKRVAERMLASPHGLITSYASDVLAVFAIGLVVGVAALLPLGISGAATLLALVLYTFCVSCLGLFLSGFGGVSGKMDAVAPFIVLITCLVGGCFGSLKQLSPTTGLLSFLTPQGLAIEAAEGNPIFLVLVFLPGVIFLTLGFFKFKSNSYK